MGWSFDWIVEHETLPPDDGRESPADGPPQDGREPRRFPWWGWPTIIVLTVAVGIVSLWWILGGEPDPLPQPDLEQIEAAAQLEVNALQDRDVEILERLASRRMVRAPG
jgi:hypothetical protein